MRTTVPVSASTASGAQAFGPDIAPHQHAVFVQRRAGGAFRDGDFLEAGIVRLEKALALAVHPDAARNQIRLARLDVAVALDAGDAARLLQFAERALQQSCWRCGGSRSSRSSSGTLAGT
jgi:hypothetical protein